MGPSQNIETWLVENSQHLLKNDEMSKEPQVAS